MVFSSLSSYLDPPNSWSQQQPTGGIGVGTVVGSGGDHELFQLPPPLLAPPPPLASGGDGRSVQVMEHGRMTTKQPDTTMKCPRCESTNTKFCYFNNYSLSQPRHFCKTCRRYWTRGGALRNVPVGGGCRRNKKSTKGSRGSSTTSRSKSPISTSNNNNTPISPNNSSDILGHFSRQQPQFPILPPLHNFEGGDLGITFGGGNGTTHDLMNNLAGHDHNTSYNPNSKLTHFPFANGGIMYGEGPSNYGGVQVGGILKMEENHQHQQQQQQGMNLSRNFLGISGNDQFLGTSNAGWSTTDLTGFPNSSSSNTTTTHLL